VSVDPAAETAFGIVVAMVLRKPDLVINEYCVG
jgi:hypothetical protein